jgi:hypothetical protein
MLFSLSTDYGLSSFIGSICTAIVFGTIAGEVKIVKLMWKVKTIEERILEQLADLNRVQNDALCELRAMRTQIGRQR